MPPLRSLLLGCLAALLVTTAAPCLTSPTASAAAHHVILIGHRGAPGYRPEHTLASYELAIAQCADYIEPDVVSTKDKKLVVRHENNLAGTTDVAEHPEFADRHTTKVIDGRRVEGWFSEDFTLAELRTLRAVERTPDVRPANTAYDGLYPVATLDEVLDLAKKSTTCSGKPVGVAPEVKHSTYFAGLGLPIEKRLAKALKAHGWTRKSDPVLIQSFETTDLKALNRLTHLRLLQIVDKKGAPYDLVAAGKKTTYRDMMTTKGLRRVAAYADGLAPVKDAIIPRADDGSLRAPRTVVRKAHKAGLFVIASTFRRENRYLPLEFRSGTDPNAPGDLRGEIAAFLATGIDGFFCDNPDLGREALAPGHGAGDRSTE